MGKKRMVKSVGFEPTRIAPLALDDNQDIATKALPKASAITTRLVSVLVRFRG